MTGKYIECDWCGYEERTDIKRNINSFRNWLSHNIEWIFVRQGNGIVYDFCSKECYDKWKFNH